MPTKPKRNDLAIETGWLRAYAETHLPTEALFEFSPADLRQAGASLVQVRNILRNCRVVYSDKLEERGALWMAEGDDGDGREFRLTLKVIEYESVTLQEIEELRPSEEEGHDAA